MDVHRPRRVRLLSVGSRSLIFPPPCSTKWHDTYIAQLKAADRSLSLSETIDIIYNAWASTPPPRTHRSFQKGGTESHTSVRDAFLAIASLLAATSREIVASHS